SRGEPRHSQAECGPYRRRTDSGRGAGTMRRTRPAADRRPARSRPLRAAGQQLSRLRHPAVLAKHAAGRVPEAPRVGSALITEQADEFREALPGGGVLMGLDLGSKTIGTAFCDAAWSFAGAGKTLPRGKFARDRAALA